MTIPCEPSVHVTVTGPVRHRCPFVDEVDEGTVRIDWRTAGNTLELHALASRLALFANTPISHEEFTEGIRRDLAEVPGIADVLVETSWTTAGLNVQVFAAGCERADVVSRQPVHAEGA